jgi:hypothetical protein
VHNKYKNLQSANPVLGNHSKGRPQASERLRPYRVREFGLLPRESRSPQSRSHPFAHAATLMVEARARRRPSRDARHHAACQLRRQ